MTLKHPCDTYQNKCLPENEKDLIELEETEI